MAWAARPSRSKENSFYLDAGQLSVVTRSLFGREQFLQFQVQRDAVLVRALLYEKHNQKVGDRPARVDDELPAIGI